MVCSGFLTGQLKLPAGEWLQHFPAFILSSVKCNVLFIRAYFKLHISQVVRRRPRLSLRSEVVPACENLKCVRSYSSSYNLYDSFSLYTQSGFTRSFFPSIAKDTLFISKILSISDKLRSRSISPTNSLYLLAPS